MPRSGSGWPMPFGACKKQSTPGSRCARRAGTLARRRDPRHRIGAAQSRPRLEAVLREFEHDAHVLARAGRPLPICSDCGPSSGWTGGGSTGTRGRSDLKSASGRSEPGYPISRGGLMGASQPLHSSHNEHPIAVGAVLRKLQLSSRHEVSRWAASRGLIDDDDQIEPMTQGPNATTTAPSAA